MTVVSTVLTGETSIGIWVREEEEEEEEEEWVEMWTVIAVTVRWLVHPSHLDTRY